MSNPPTADGVMDAIGRAARHLPHLRVVVTPHCAGHPWVIDTKTCTVYVDGSVAPDMWSDQLADALGRLRVHHGIPEPRTELHLVPPLTFHEDLVRGVG